MSFDPQNRDASARTPARCFWRALIAALPLLALAHAPHADAGSIVVGRSGPTNGCTVPSIQAAINRANGFGGHNVILVTDDVADGVYHENLNLRDLRSGLRLEIVGGFNNCRDLASTASGKASVYGGGTSAPVVNIEGDVDLVMRGLWMEGGTRGIRWSGRGRVDITYATINNNGKFGIDVTGNGGNTYLNVLGNVDIANHTGYGAGIYAERAAVIVRGDGNSIRRNYRGIEITNGARVDIGATGAVIRENRDQGLYIHSLGASATPSFVYSVNPANPLAIASNAGGAIVLTTTGGTNEVQKLCLRNILVRSNAYGIGALGPQTHVEMNGTTCAFPVDADIVCNGINYMSCNTFYDNQGAHRLMGVELGAKLDITGVLLYRNRSNSLFSTNLGWGLSPSSITMTRSVAVENTVRDSLFEALDGGIVDVWDSTIAANLGGFGVSLVSNNPGLLQLTNTILDQPQTLMAHTGSKANVQLNRVLAPNQTGAEEVSRTMLIGRPTFINDVGRLSPFSLGVDYAPAGGGVDRDGNPRDVDTLDVPNVFGPRDLGAYEVQQTITDRIMKGGFESGEGQ